MGKVRPINGVERGDRRIWRVVDNLESCPVTPAELDAVEAFLMPLVNALLERNDAVAIKPKPAPDSSLPQFPALEGG
jgi:hypothetical protein